jgi:two-component system alkaline phosphatase synthesis response regulator PhoP
MQPRADILVVEDEPDIRSLIVLHLEREGFRCRTAATGSEALRAVKRQPPDLVVLDLLLPELGGLEVCRRLRAERESSELPIIMLTARAEEVDRVVGLELGADDYVTKPFSPKELVARVRAVLRRTRRPPAPAETVIGTLAIDRGRHTVRLAGRPLTLTPKEFDLLETLVNASGRLLTREQLLGRVWGYARADDIESRTVDVHVHRLRAKLGPEGHRLVTVKGAGYRFETGG